jgi:hypothetical protein
MEERLSEAAGHEMLRRANPGDHTARRRGALKAGAGRVVRPQGRITTVPLEGTAAEDTAGVMQLRVHPHERTTTVAVLGGVM